MKASTRSPILGSLAILLLTVVVYWPALHGGFIWDDDDHLTANPVMTAPDGLHQIWSSLSRSRYYPLTLTTFWMQHRCWGLDPLPYHAVNVVLHAVNAVLIVAVLKRLRVPGAWAAAALWALHPVNVESVAWVTELKNTQSGLSFFLSLLCYLRSEEHWDYRWYMGALLCGAAAMLSKPSTVVLPAVLVMIVSWQRGRCRVMDCWRAAPLFVFACAMSVLTIIEQRGAIEHGGRQVVLGGAERVLLTGKVLWFYLGKVIWPANLMFIYPQWELHPISFSNWLPLASALAVGGGLWAARKRPLVRGSLLGLGYFVLLLLPVSGLFSIYFFRYSFVADHFQYLASLGPLAALVAGGAVVVRNQRIRAAGAGLVLLVLAAQSWRYCHVFQSEEALWRDAVAKNPGSWMAHANMGFVLWQAGNIGEAITEYETSLRIKPDNEEAHNGMGLVLAAQGKPVEAIAEYQAALQVNPQRAETHNNLGNVFASQGKLEEAAAEYQATLRFDPNIAEAHNNLGSILAGQGKIAEASVEYAAALRIKPDYANAHDNLGTALALEGRTDEAVAQYREALRLNPDLRHALHRLAWIFATNRNASLRNGPEAVRLGERLITVTSGRQADALVVLAAAYGEVGRFADAVSVARQASRLASDGGQQALVARIEQQIQLYQDGHPCREGTASSSSIQ